MRGLHVNHILWYQTEGSETRFDIRESGCCYYSLYVSYKWTKELVIFHNYSPSSAPAQDWDAVNVPPPHTSRPAVLVRQLATFANLNPIILTFSLLLAFQLMAISSLAYTAHESCRGSSVVDLW